MGGQLALLLLFLSISTSNGLQCTNFSTKEPIQCIGNNPVCLVTIVGREIVATACGAPLESDCMLIITESPTPTLASECYCSTDGCDKDANAFSKQLDKMAAAAKMSVALSDGCKTAGKVSVVIYTVLFGLALAFVPAIIFFIVRLFCSKRKMDKLEQTVSTSLRQLQADMGGTSKNVQEVRKKMESLATCSDATLGGQSVTREQNTVKETTATTTPAIDSAKDPKKEESVKVSDNEKKKEEKKEETREEKTADEPAVKSVSFKK